MKELSVKDLVLMAFYVALFMVLDVLSNALPLFKMPNGGTLGISSIALLMASYQLGWKKGLVVALVSVMAMFMTGPMYTPDLLGFVLDYLLAFSAYGLACLFPNFPLHISSSRSIWIFSGVFMTNLFRFLFSTLSGVIVWKVDLWGSIVYQAAYMIPTTLLGMVLVPLLYAYLQPRLKSQRS